MHANIETSSRLLKLLKLLSDGMPHSSAEIQRKTRSMAVHTDIHELRCNGVNVSPALYYGKSRAGRKIYRYRLAVS